MNKQQDAGFVGKLFDLLRETFKKTCRWSLTVQVQDTNVRGFSRNFVARLLPIFWFKSFAASPPAAVVLTIPSLVIVSRSFP